MDPLTFADTLGTTFARLTLAAGLMVLVLTAAVSWALAATRTDEVTGNE